MMFQVNKERPTFTAQEQDARISESELHSADNWLCVGGRASVRCVCAYANNRNRLVRHKWLIIQWAHHNHTQ